MGLLIVVGVCPNLDPDHCTCNVFATPLFHVSGPHVAKIVSVLRFFHFRHDAEFKTIEFTPGQVLGRVGYIITL